MGKDLWRVRALFKYLYKQIGESIYHGGIYAMKIGAFVLFVFLVIYRHLLAAAVLPDKKATYWSFDLH